MGAFVGTAHARVETHHREPRMTRTVTRLRHAKTQHELCAIYADWLDEAHASKADRHVRDHVARVRYAMQQSITRTR